MTRDVVTIEGLRHTYGRTLALDGVDLTVAPGECVALLGPNGAGRPRWVNALTGLQRPTAGRVEIDGDDPQRAETRKRIGVVQQSVGFPRTLTVGELVAGWAVRYGRTASAAEPVLRELGITDLRGRRTHKLSGGQQQRLQLAMALVADPTLLVLDEPTAGLDVASRRAFWRILAARRARGAAVLLTTHQIEEAAATADRVVVLHEGRVVVLHEGRVVAEGSPIELTSRLPDRSISARTTLDEPHLHKLPGVVDVTVDAGRARLTSTAPEAAVRTLLDADPYLTDLRVEAASLEAAVALTVREAVTNVVRHAAAGRCTIGIVASGDQVMLTVADDGVGTTAPDGSGLAGMRERIAALGGAVERRMERGTTLMVTVPAQEVAG